MTSPKSIFYTYKYVWEDGTPYYIGKGQKNRAFKNHGVIPVPEDRNRIIFLIENVAEKEALQHEKVMIKFYGRKDLGTGPLLNRTRGGQGTSGRVITEEEREWRRKAGNKNKENKTGICGMTSEEKSEAGKKGGKIAGNKCKENKTGIFGLSLEEMIENSKKGGNKNKENKTGFCGMTSEEKSEAGKIGGNKTKENKTGIFGRSPEKHSEDSKKGGKIGGKKGGKIGGPKGGKASSSQKWQCTETGYVSNAGGLTRYQKAKGIDTAKRIKVDGTRGWEITFEDGRVIVITIPLKTWAKENGYSYQCLFDVRKGKNKKHKGIIKVVAL